MPLAGHRFDSSRNKAFGGAEMLGAGEAEASNARQFELECGR
jgi:hypothetical protein